jgi:2-keto-4-pentenoate hydratase/2-oxohepta-3-ene-1,7-dioic acid hydratase in catechol pathway
MRIANLSGRLALIAGELAVDVAAASGGRFSADPQAVYEQFDEFREWAASAPLLAGTAFDPAQLGAPAPRPRQVFAIGLNYRAHAAESGLAAPPSPAVFTKFVTSVSGPYTVVRLPEGRVDWEVELVAVIGRRAEHAAAR